MSDDIKTLLDEVAQLRRRVAALEARADIQPLLDRLPKLKRQIVAALPGSARELADRLYPGRGSSNPVRALHSNISLLKQDLRPLGFDITCRVPDDGGPGIYYLEKIND